MPLTFSFSSALSGLKASSNSLGVVGNNIANSNTLGFKSGNLTFADLFYGSYSGSLNGAGNPLQIGNGVRTGAVSTNFSQGNISNSGSPTDMAIQGNGYFVMRDAAGVQTYTRAGNFTIDRNGFLVGPGGQQLQGYTAVNGTVPSDAALGSLKIPLGQTLDPKATTTASLHMNLNAAEPTGTKFTSTIQVYDSLGAPHSLNLVYTKTSDLNYSVTGYVDDPANTVTVNPAALAFDSNGVLQTPAAPGTLAVDTSSLPATVLKGATLGPVNVNLYDGQTPLVTNFTSPSGVSSITQDGYPAGSISGLALDRTGTIQAVFTNGQTRSIGQVALALFNSQDGLTRLGGNLFGETTASGPAAIGRPGSGGRGDTVGNALEESNVDIATEFTNLIVAQRSFQANSRVITTVNQTLQDLLQII